MASSRAIGLLNSAFPAISRDIQTTIGIPVGILIVLATYKCIIYPAFFSTLARIPNARWHTSFCPLWSYYIKWANIENNTVYHLHKKLGPIVRIGPSELSVNCYEGGLKTIYTGGFPKTDWYANRFNSYGYANMFTMIDSKEHSQRKRMLSHIYSKSVVLASQTTSAATREVVFHRLLPIFEKSAQSSAALEVHKLNYAYAMDSFTSYQFGLKLGSNLMQDVEKREWYLKHFFSRRPWLFWTTEMPRLTEWLRKLGIRLVPKWCDNSTTQLEVWNLEICDRAERLVTENPSISVDDPGKWPAVYAAQRQKFKEADTKSGQVDNKQPYPRRLEIAGDMFCHSAAALETSGDTLTWLYYEMSRRPYLQAKLRDELMTLSPPITFPLHEDGTLPDFKQLDGLRLLDSILQETLRLWVAVPGGQPRVTPPGVCSLAGYDNIPEGVRVQASAYTLHRDPEVFPDPDAWKPGRWLDATPEELLKMRRWFWAFGSGGRMCIGNHIAIHTMKMAVASIYSIYTTHIVDADGIEQDEGFTAGPKGNKLLLRIERS